MRFQPSRRLSVNYNTQLILVTLLPYVNCTKRNSSAFIFETYVLSFVVMRPLDLKKTPRKGKVEDVKLPEAIIYEALLLKCPPF